MTSIDQAKLCPIRETDTKRNLECLKDRCAWWVASESMCALPALSIKVNYVVEALEGYDQRGMLVRTREA